MNDALTYRADDTVASFRERCQRRFEDLMCRIADAYSLSEAERSKHRALLNALIAEAREARAKSLSMDEDKCDAEHGSIEALGRWLSGDAT